ncbi:MAG: hypothetical protein WBF33_00615 [Candidatus Nitrosopolaris sp.]
MSNKNRIEYVAIALVVALLAAVATVPLKYAAAQNVTSQNATSSQIEQTMPESMIKGEVAKLKAEHPVFAAVLDTVRSMNATETLKAILAVHALERILDAHALNLEYQAFINSTR